MKFKIVEVFHLDVLTLGESISNQRYCSKKAAEKAMKKIYYLGHNLEYYNTEFSKNLYVYAYNVVPGD